MGCRMIGKKINRPAFHHFFRRAITYLDAFFFGKDLRRVSEITSSTELLVLCPRTENTRKLTDQGCRACCLQAHVFALKPLLER
ncbi:hypothetical protein Y032_0270g876 [Ancylostoma ceylanicum]|uniref:Uncharacterized protein n=1 Tax=Ancylostoma ceylanicum TaxID=53326 RepID=A0A016S9H8_9BILA|nr:hypothetical protein Y032_0270g876 [Ancylostoma ceylanicum]